MKEGPIKRPAVVRLHQGYGIGICVESVNEAG